MEWQDGPVFCDKRFMGLFAGRRAGKTDAIKARMKLKLQRRGFRYTYISPLSAQGEQVWREMIADASWRPRILKAARRPYPHFFMRNKATLWFRSMQRPEGIRSTGEDEICADESQDPTMTENAIDTVILPMLADRRGSLLISGQFRGEDYRFTRFWIPGQREVDGKPNPKYNPAFASWRFPTSVGYCFQDASGKAELELMKSITPQPVWEQEWECVPRSNANAVFKSEQVDAISVAHSPRLSIEEYPARGDGYCVCIDLGGISDPLGLIVGHTSGDVVYAKQWPLGLDDRQLAREAMEVASFFRGLVVVDSTGKGKPGRSDSEEERVEFYRRDAAMMGLEFQDVYQTTNKERLVLNLRTAIQQGEIVIAAELKEVCDQLKAYEYTYNPRHKIYQYGAPLGKHDEYVSCCMMFREAMNRNWIRRTGSGRPLRTGP